MYQPRDDQTRAVIDKLATNAQAATRRVCGYIVGRVKWSFCRRDGMGWEMSDYKVCSAGIGMREKVPEWSVGSSSSRRRYTLGREGMGWDGMDM